MKLHLTWNLLVLLLKSSVFILGHLVRDLPHLSLPPVRSPSPLSLSLSFPASSALLPPSAPYGKQTGRPFLSSWHSHQHRQALPTLFRQATLASGIGEDVHGALRLLGAQSAGGRGGGGARVLLCGYRGRQRFWVTRGRRRSGHRERRGRKTTGEGLPQRFF